MASNNGQDRTISRACEQFHPAICLLEEAHGLREMKCQQCDIRQQIFMRNLLPKLAG